MSEVKNMPHGWVETTLGEAADVSTGYPFKSNDYSYTGTLRVVRGENVSLGKLRWDSQKYWEHSTNDLEKYFLKENDIVVGMDGSRIGKNKSSINIDELPLILAQRVARIYAKKDCFQGYIKYCVLNENFEKYIIKIQTGTSIPHISLAQIKDYNFYMPKNINEQKSIASILTAFDDKIELLQAQNKTLELTAQTIFTEWFGKYSVDDALPEGWSVGKLGNEFDITIGRTPPRIEQEWFSNIPTGKKWISIKDIGNSGTYIFNTSEYLTDEAIKKFNIPIIPENTTILSFKMTVGKLTITTEDMLSNEAIAHLKLKVDTVLSTEFIYLYLQNLDFNALGSTSSIVTAINSTMIKAIEVVIPNKAILLNFNEAIKPLFDKIKLNTEQIQNLTKTRDELLPRLMSGEIRVNEFKN